MRQIPSHHSFHLSLFLGLFFALLLVFLLGVKKGAGGILYISIFFSCLPGMGNAAKWKEDLVARATSKQGVTLMQLVYGQLTASASKDVRAHMDSDYESDEDELFQVKKNHSEVCFVLL